ncbi:MAG: S41 family peptidase [Porphyromonas sp.]|nr:S41 family peptidase [Porphyromonas sp.]
MKNKSLPSFVKIIILVIVLGAGIFIGSRPFIYHFISYGNGTKATGIQKVEKALQLIKDNYVDEVSIDSIVQNIVPTIFASLDPHSSYFTKEDYEKESDRLSGHIFGVGISFNKLIDTVVVLQTVPNGPSDIVGIKTGDRIITVDSINIAGKEVSQDSIMRLLKGPKDSSVRLSVHRPSEKKNYSFNIKRGQIPVPLVSPAFLLSDSIGYINIKSFGQTTTSEFQKAAISLIKEGAKALILDLRDNSGGLVQGALLIANDFLPKDRLVTYTEGRANPRKDYVSDGSGSFQNLPVYVLISQFSASSSELLAGALQDNDRAILIGRRSFGKGVIQQPFFFSDGSAIHLTIARYYTPSGRSIQKKYELGQSDRYSEDLIKRSLSGEWFNKDSIHSDKSLLFRTVGGREVYGGGGIIPDIFVAQDTIGVTSYYTTVMKQGLISEYAFRYVDARRDLFEKLGGIEKALPYLKSQSLLYDFSRFASTKGITPKSYLIFKSRELILEAIFSQILFFAYDDIERTKLLALNDWDILEAQKLMKEGFTSPLHLEGYKSSSHNRYQFYPARVSETDQSEGETTEIETEE